MKEKLVPLLAVAAAACAGPQVKESPEPGVAEVQCATFADLVRTVGANQEGLQPDGTFVACVGSERDVTYNPPHLALREAQLEAMQGAVEAVCSKVAQARGCETRGSSIGSNKLREFDVGVVCPDASKSSVCNAEVGTRDSSHCVTLSGMDIFCVRAKANPDSVLENPLQLRQ